jgi:hypothetical protein
LAGGNARGDVRAIGDGSGINERRRSREIAFAA